MEHYTLFVNSIFTLSKELITETELLKCEEDLLIFVAKFEVIYGTEAMTFNVYVSIHLVENVLRTGPLWATFAVAFERNIFLLKRTLQGPNGAAHQMSTRTLQRLSYKFERRPLSIANDAKEFCKSVFNKERFTASAVTVNDVIFFLKRKVATNKALEKNYFIDVHIAIKSIAALNILDLKNLMML